MGESKTPIYLADLTHVGPIISAGFHPLGIGLIAAYADLLIGDRFSFELFKYPDDLAAGLEKNPPRVLGLSNYSWNFKLSYTFAQKVKARHPDTIIVFGGPNYGTSEEELADFWARYRDIDIHMVGEGEVAFTQLLEALEAVDFDLTAFKNSLEIQPSCHFIGNDGELKLGELVPRIRDLAALPSPYLNGMMDKFFDNTLVPLIHTTRGCPFKCTFCTEGRGYYNKVVKRYELDAELEYIASRVGDVHELMISDANFGMFKEDIDKAHILNRIYKEYGWPSFIQVNGGKNQKERLLSVATILGGRMRVSAALQSSDPEILANIKRSNISYGELETMGRETQRIDARADLELILCLPGDSRERHVKSLRDGVASGIPTIRMHQLILLPQTEMNEPATRDKFGFETRHRLMPRSFGRYRLYGETFDSVETEEICVASKTMSSDDYLECREFDLTIETIHNGNVFRELIGLSRYLGVTWFDVIECFHNQRHVWSNGIKSLYDTFRADNLENQWSSPEAASRAISDRMDEFLSNSQGTNEMAKAKAMAWSLLQKDIHEAVYAAFRQVLRKRGTISPDVEKLLDQLQEYSWQRKRDLLTTENGSSGRFDFDFRKLFDSKVFDLSENELGIADIRADHPIEFVFEHDSEQERLIAGYVHEFGQSIDGLGRILMLAPVQRMFRQVSVNPPLN